MSKASRREEAATGGEAYRVKRIQSKRKKLLYGLNTSSRNASYYSRYVAPTKECQSRSRSRD